MRLKKEGRLRINKNSLLSAPGTGYTKYTLANTRENLEKVGDAHVKLRDAIKEMDPEFSSNLKKRVPSKENNEGSEDQSDSDEEETETVGRIRKRLSK